MEPHLELCDIVERWDFPAPNPGMDNRRAFNLLLNWALWADNELRKAGVKHVREESNAKDEG